MKAFISYTHKDDHMLQLFHTHLIQLKRENIITTWTDEDILAGGKINDEINISLHDSQIFIALLSPDYIASNYCYEKEMQTALEKEKKGDIIIVPVIVESCDWHNTPFADFKALPKDGKPISTWENKNTAMLDVIQNLRKLLSQSLVNTLPENNFNQIEFTRNYRVKTDFDSIQKLEFLESTFKEVKEFLGRYLEEIAQLDNIKTRILNDSDTNFECLLVNRNKIDTEAQLTLSTKEDSSSSIAIFNRMGFEGQQLFYSISKTKNPLSSRFVLSFDEFHLFWKKMDFYPSDQKEFTSKEIADEIWNELLNNVGIL